MARKTTYFCTRTRLIATAVSACFTASAYALPSDPTVVNGSASFAQAGSVLNITNSNGAIINWNTFSIGANEITRFIQSSSSSSVLNRVLADPSVILGTLTSNGRVFLINPNGIYVGQGARIDVAGFVASTLNISDANFLANKLQFDATPNAGSVVNQGSITTPSGGTVYLVAPNVTNEGIITTPQGETILAAGQSVTLLDTATPGVSVEITGAEGNATNLGTVVAEAGRIGIAGVLVKNSGTLNASSVVNEGGRIFLKAAGTVETTAASNIAADGTNGGNVMLIADDTGSFAGTISARGTAQGGFVETSGHRFMSVSGLRVDTRAANGSAGTWLLDPADVVIASGTATGSSDFSPTGSTSTIYDGDINASLATTNVNITTSSGSGGSGNVTINGYYDAGGAVYINTSSASGPRKLSLNADGNLDIHYGASLSGSSAAPLTIDLLAGGNITYAGSIYSYSSVALLAKGAITFGDTSGSGYLSSAYDSPVTLVANWDGNTTIPGVAATTNCAAGASYCGISGSGSIASNYGISGSGSSSGSLVNAGAVNLKAPGDIDLSSISINATGGYYSSSTPGGVGGAGGNVSIASTHGNLTTGYIDASGSSGGYGASGTSTSPNGGTGGMGGAGGSVSLSTPGTLTLTNNITATGGSGGSGGNGYYYWDGSSYIYTGTGGAGGVGGNAGTLTVNSASLALAGTTLDFHGGTGGSGGYDGTAYGTAAAMGSSSPIVLTTAGDIVLTGSNDTYGSKQELLAGKSIVFGDATTTTYGYLYTYNTPTTLVANWDGVSATTPAVAATGNCTGGSLCGISGSGSIYTNGYYYYYYGYGTVGGDLTIKAAGDIDLSQVSINTSGNSGYYATSLAGGTGGNVSIVSTQGNLTVGYINASGGSGGSGASGSSTSPNGGAGGVGGAGGSISLATPGTLTLGNSIYATGGSGGTGGSGYEYWDSATSTYIYTGTGGIGGAGGNAGTLAVSGASLALAGTALNFLGGAGGSGGYDGTAYGTAGAMGSGSPIVLTTAGDIVLTGSNDTYGSKQELLAGRSITFGNITTTYGYIYTYGGAPMTLVANWDGVSATTPAVAATGNCTGSSLCGISGSGSINTYGYYYYGQAGGAVTIKAAGDIDLSQVSINASGNSGYYATTLTGGAGGNVSIASTQGNLTVSGINASGGSGGYGASGTSTSPNGGAGGVGGAGGSISLTTPGTLTLGNYYYYYDGITARGGNGGTGGSSYYYYDYPTSTYIYAGTGGAGGAGGNAGTLTTSSASLILAGTALNFQGGAGGSGGYDGTAYGTAAAMGSSSPIVLATAGDIVLTGSNYAYGSKLELLAGKSIAFGDTTTTTYGYLYTDNTPTTLVANWDGVSATTPAVAATGNCTGSSLCGISGSGSIYTNYDYYDESYYGYGQAGGSLTIKAAGDIDLSQVSIDTSGNSGYYATTLTGGAGGNVSIASTQGNLTAGYIDASGGSGGSGASGSSTSPNGGAGGVGGAGGSISLATPGTLTLGNSIYATGGSGGTGGSGYEYWDSATSTYIYTGTGGNGGAGGAGGSITLSGSTITQDNYSSLHAAGGGGGYGDYYYYYYDMVSGVAGNGGAGGSVSLVATGDITVTDIDVGGGYGAGGGGGVASSVNGLVGGVGGAGGSITLKAGGTLTLTGNINTSGGGGGSGGSGYYYWDSATSTNIYTGAGGTGGAGGNAGTLAVSGASLALAGTALNFLGGAGGSGGYDGTAYGTAGAIGSGSPIVLATAGDIELSGSNYAYGSKLELLAGKSIAFGNDTTTYGDLYTDNTPATLVANWDGVSATTPAVAATGNCTGSSLLCGISGSGSINTNNYYYYDYYGYGVVGGDLIIKAAGDIDLSQMEIGTSGNSGYYATSLAGGAGGNVSITSTKGNLTVGYIDASGGYGGYGASGTSTSPNGGAGGVGGAGGNISLSTPGTLTLTGSVYAAGGSGGTGGSGYYDYSLATPAYTGTGGNGNAGGMGGGITASAASIDASASYISANGGNGGTAGSGLAGGLAGISGAGGAMSLASVAGNIAVDFVDAGTVRIVAAGGISLHGAVSSDAAGDAVVLAGNSFSDNGGLGTISAPNGRWLVYSASPMSDDYSGLAYDFKQYNAPYGVSTTVLGSGNGLLYSLNPIPTLTLSDPGVTTKTYDGTVSAPVGFIPPGATSVSLINGDSGTITALGTAVYNDAHVALANSLLVGFSLGTVTDSNGKPVYGYSTSFSASVAGSITPAVLTVNGNWSTPASWIGGVLPQNTDLLGVLIAGSTNVTFDGLGGPTSIPYLTSAGKFSMADGALTVGGAFSTVDYSQSGGTLTASSAGINSAGIISQTGGSLTTPTLTTVSVGGTTLNGANAIGSIQAGNSGSGDITLTNTGALAIAGISNTAGNIVLSNAGPVSMSGSQIYTSTGTVTLTVLNASSLALDNGSSIVASGAPTIAGVDGRLYGVSIAASGVSLNHGSHIDATPPESSVGILISEGNLTLDNGSQITAGNDVVLTLTGADAQVVLNSAPGEAPSTIKTEYTALTTHINFLSRTAGGIVIDGTSGITTTDGGSGFYALGKPATQSNGLNIVYPGSGSGSSREDNVATQVIDQYLGEVTQITGTTSDDDKKKKDEDSGNNEGNNHDEHHNGTTGQCT